MASVSDLLIRKKAPTVFLCALLGLLALLLWAPINLKILSVGGTVATVVFAIHCFASRLSAGPVLHLSIIVVIGPGLVFIRDIEQGILMYGLSVFVVLGGLHWLARSIQIQEPK